MRPLLPYEERALVAWRNVHGRYWRNALNTAWQIHCYLGVADEHATVLAQMRNVRGPGWLARVKFPA